MDYPRTDIGQMYKDSLAEVERLLSSRSVVGEPITMEGTTVVPLVSTGFGFGAGGGSGVGPQNTGEGAGGGTGAGGGVRPVAVLVFSRDGVRVERVASPSGFEAIGTALGRVIERETKE